jgi:hypothetical protein
LAGRADGRVPASSNKRRCNLFSKPFFPIPPDDLSYSFFGCARQPVGGARAPRRVHAHVERRVVLEREAAIGAVELQRGHPEVVEHGHDRPEIGRQRTDPVGQLVVARMHQVDA